MLIIGPWEIAKRLDLPIFISQPEFGGARVRHASPNGRARGLARRLRLERTVHRPRKAGKGGPVLLRLSTYVTGVGVVLDISSSGVVLAHVQKSIPVVIVVAALTRSVSATRKVSATRCTVCERR